MSSPPKCLWIGRQTKVNALVGKNDKTPVKITLIPTHTINIFTSFLYHSEAFPIRQYNTKRSLAYLCPHIAKIYILYLEIVILLIKGTY